MWPIRSLIKWFYPGFDFQLHTEESLFAKSWFVLVFCFDHQLRNYSVASYLNGAARYLDENKNSQFFYELTERVMRRYQID